MSRYKVYDFGNSVPSHDERRRIHRDGGVVVNLDTNYVSRTRNNTNQKSSPMVVIPNNATKEQRSAAARYAMGISMIYREQFQVGIMPRVVTTAQNGRGRPATIHTEPYALTDKRAVGYFSSPEGVRRHAELLKSTFGTLPGAQFSIPHDPSRGDYGAHANGTNEVKQAEALIPHLQGLPPLPGRPEARPQEQQMLPQQQPKLQPPPSPSVVATYKQPPPPQPQQGVNRFDFAAGYSGPSQGPATHPQQPPATIQQPPPQPSAVASYTAREEPSQPQQGRPLHTPPKKQYSTQSANAKTSGVNRFDYTGGAKVTPNPPPPERLPTQYGATWINGDDGMQPLFASDATPAQLREHFPKRQNTQGIQPLGNYFKGFFR